MNQETGLRSTETDCIFERTDAELRIRDRSGSPANNPPGEQIQECSNEEPAFLGPDRGEIGYPGPVGRLLRELARQQILSLDVLSVHHSCRLESPSHPPPMPL